MIFILRILPLLMVLTACGDTTGDPPQVTPWQQTTSSTAVTFTVAANSCTGGAVANVNVYMTAGNLQFHGCTDTSGSLTLPEIANIMPAGNYDLRVLGPKGMICYPTADCNTVMPLTMDVPGTLTVYCR